MKKVVNTTEGVREGGRAMTEALIQAEFQKVAGQLDGCEKRVVTITPAPRECDDVVELGYNGRMFLIKRGEPVELPEPLIEVLSHANLL